MKSKKPIYLSVVIPVYNEQETLPAMFSRLIPVLDKLKKPYEVIFINDGSKDNSFTVLAKLHAKRPDVIKVIDFMRNYGQHPAIIAGFKEVKGEVIVTLDCDLQNPPEDIPKLLKLIEQGHDVVGGYRGNRNDPAWRRLVSKCSNLFREYIIKVKMVDHGCMLRAYRQTIVEQIIESSEASPFITVLSQYFAANPAEIEVGHEERAAGVSNYNFFKLVRYNFDLVTGFSTLPLQIFTFTGMFLSIASFGLVVLLVLRRLILGPEAFGIFTLFAILFFLLSVIILGLGLIGEYIGRIYTEVRHRPRFVIKQTLETKKD